MIDLKKLQQLKDRLTTDEAAKNRAEGKLQELRKQLLKEHGCKTIEDAERMLKQLEKDEKRLEGDFDKLLRKFEADYEKHMGE